MDVMERDKEEVLYEFLKEAVLPIYQGEIPNGFEGRKNLLKVSLSYFPEDRIPLLKKIIGIASAQYAYLKAKKILEETEPDVEQREDDLKKILKTFNILNKNLEKI